MSLWSKYLRSLSNRPILHYNDSVLTIKNSFLQRLLILFSDMREVVINPHTSSITYRERVLYYHQNQYSFAFDDISYIDYNYRSLFQNAFHHGYFCIKLMCKDEREFLLAEFFDVDPEDRNPHTRIFHAPRVSLGPHTPEAESRRVAAGIADLIGVPLGKPYIKEEYFIPCPQCGIPTSRRREKCLYCHHVLHEAEPEPCE